MDIRHVDLNLIAVFNAIMADGSVSGAARSLRLSQSAVSHALARLRVITGDELFTRTSHGVKPTREALALAAPFRSAVDLVQIALSAKYGRTPKKRLRTFNLDLPVGFDVILVPQLMTAAAQFGINAQFKISSVASAIDATPADNSEAELSLHYLTPKARGFVCEALYKDEFLVCARKGHPDLSSGLEEARYLSLGHVTLNWAPYGSPVDERLAELAIDRHVLAFLPTLAGCASVVANSNLLFTIHARVASVLAARFDLHLFPMPFAIDQLTMHMIWRRRFSKDPEHRWLRNSLKQIVHNLHGAERQAMNGEVRRT